MIAMPRGVSRTRRPDQNPCKSSLSSLHDPPVEPARRHVDLRERLPVQPDGALCDQASRLARRRNRQMLDEECREMHGLVAGLEADLWYVLGRLPITHDACEMPLRA